MTREIYKIKESLQTAQTTDTPAYIKRDIEDCIGVVVVVFEAKRWMGTPLNPRAADKTRGRSVRQEKKREVDVDKYRPKSP